jgi:hypothetical protein
MLLRDADALRRIGVSAELFDDHSPLQLGAAGRRQGVPFTVVGRLQYGYEGGSWNEWHVLFDSGGDERRSAWLSEDNGSYVLAFDVELPADAPPLHELQAGEARLIGGQTWSVASIVRARLIAAEGELPRPPRPDREFLVADLRNALDEVGTLDGSDPAHVQWSIGRAAALSELALTGLREVGDKRLSARSIGCPGCGAAVEIRLDSTKSVVCGQCAAVIDVSAGVGAELAHYAQAAGGVPPQIPLGRSGTLALGGPLQAWQVVGYLERRDLPAPGDEDESTAWREYLLYHRTEGFVFLVDTDEGWSWVRPITGVPALRGDLAEWQGAVFRQRWDYAARVTRVLGEFYWRVQRDERARVTDYEGTGADRRRRLSRERVGDEVTWSAGEVIEADTVAAAFGLPPGGPGLRRDVAPFTADTSLRNVMWIIVALFAVAMLMQQCSDDGCDDVLATFGAASTEYRQCLARSARGGFRGGGGSFGGWSSGGGHK